MGNLLCCVEVEESTVAMRERFGKFDSVMEPGCHFVPWFLGLQARGPLSLRLRQLEIRCPTKTKDNVYVTIVTCVQYRALADKASHAFYTLINTRSQIQAHVFDVLRTSIPKLALEEVFDKKKEIAEALEEEVAEAMAPYGYEVMRALVVDVEPEEAVRRAMGESRAAADRAVAERAARAGRAEADAEAARLAGVGAARHRQAVVDGLRACVVAFCAAVPGATPREVMDMVLVAQYLDTVREIAAASASGCSAAAAVPFLPHGPAAARDAVAQIRDGLLQAVQPPAAAAASVAAVGLPLPLPVASVCEGITEEQ
ncbi:hypersensitive-induced response protein 1-like [Oryza glaberrima]|uniref:hypersensitive-induced response protein 1-like n=1 Tax=Oryza glaberrima TaxID=4538 RepID=UPI00224C0447|nr:hypersensitive-induced response protein 1-like [Oryza glaberrima]XP_052140676.1 hypersensitive-induced response protein 1-like [Oryza glaberrima]